MRKTGYDLMGIKGAVEEIDFLVSCFACITQKLELDEEHAVTTHALKYLIIRLGRLSQSMSDGEAKQ